MASKINKKFAIISVSDKSNIDQIAKKLVENNYNILSTGGTAKFLTSKNIPNISISTFTNFNEILEGRVKTLHPKIHAGILAKNKQDLKSLKDNNSIAFKYCDEKGNTDENCNPNGSSDNIAGILNYNKNILGLMPHPERMIDPLLSGEDGSILFKSLQKA